MVCNCRQGLQWDKDMLFIIVVEWCAAFSISVIYLAQQLFIYLFIYIRHICLFQLDSYLDHVPFLVLRQVFVVVFVCDPVQARINSLVC